MQQLPEPVAEAAGTEHRLKFAANNDFQTELRRRVDEYIRRTHLKQRDCPRMYAKTAIVLSVFAAAYVLLVFFTHVWWQALPLAVLLGLATAEIGFNIQHDGSHKAYSNHAWVNKLMAMSLDMVGGSSYVWRWKHVVFHHMYVNVEGHDTDIDLSIFGRLSPHQPHRVLYRWQHLYLWPLYGVVVMKWQFYDDFRDVITGHMGVNPFPRPRGWELVIFIGGKLTFLTLAFGIPLLMHPLWAVLLFYTLTAGIVGVVLSVVFQLAHVVEEARFPLPDKDSGRIENAWAIHQVQSSVDFARRDLVVSWLVGGLNFQIEHHLFPRLSHVNYPAISKLVEDTCREFGIEYKENPTFGAGVASHFRWLRRMGEAPARG
jgi:linoleoyl-CoA desaturase